MAEDRNKISTGPNDRTLNETIAGTGPGIPDEALGPGEELFTPPSEAEVRRTARKLGVPGSNTNRKIATGVAVGIGSAAIVAALLYATRPKRKK